MRGRKYAIVKPVYNSLTSGNLPVQEAVFEVCVPRTWYKLPRRPYLVPPTVNVESLFAAIILFLLH